MNYKNFEGLKLSEIGIGTYLGNIDDKTDKNYYETIKAAVDIGINVIDTAINYRNTRSEKVIGKVLKQIDRSSVIVSTKGGYIFAPDNVEEPNKWFKETLIDTKIVKPEDISPTGNIQTREYISWSFNESLKNMDTDYIDIYFLHNPEDQLIKHSKDEFYKKLYQIFEFLEQQISKGRLKYYGMATWNGFRLNENEKQYLNLAEVVNIAKSVSGNSHHFKFIQLPYNIIMNEAYRLKNQSLNDKRLSVFEVAKELGVYTYTSATLMQTRLILQNPKKELLDEFYVEDPVHIPIQFARSTDGVGTALIGMSKKEHLIENVKIENFKYLTQQDIDTIINSY